MIRIEHLTKKAEDGHLILKDISLHISPGEIISVIGPSGCGKSTLLRCLNALSRPTSGKVFVDGEDIFSREADLPLIRRKVGMVFQQFNTFRHLSVLENVMLGPLKLLKKDRGEAEAEARELLRSVGLGEKAHVMPDRLSGGELQRVEIARCLAMHPEIILFDEPTSALDQVMENEVLGVISALAKKGMTMVIVTHNLEFARKVSTRVLFMHGGEVCEDGTPEEIFAHPKQTLTQIFIRSYSSLLFDITSKGYDLYKMNARIEWFCSRYHLGQRYFTLELLVEEFLTKLLPFSGDIHIRIFIDDGGEVVVEIEQEHYSAEILGDEAQDDISLMIVQGLCSSIEETGLGDSRLIHLILANRPD